jgi:hypothetical protein
MKILIASAAPFSGLSWCQDILVKAGLNQALPFDSPAGKITPNQWHKKLLAANGLDSDLSMAENKLGIGKMWEDLAVGMLQANMNQKEWGFADERSVWALEFWAVIEPQTRFALGYVSLGQAIAIYRQIYKEVTDDNIHSLALAWVAWNTELLAFAQKQGKRAVFFNLYEGTTHPSRLANTCSKKLGLQMLDWQKLEGNEPTSWPTSEDLVDLRLPNLGAVRSLQKKLDAACTALLNPNTQVMTTPQKDKGLDGWSIFGVFGKSRQLTQELNQTRFDLQKAQADLTHASEQLADLEVKQQELKIEHQRHTRLAAEELESEKEKAKVTLRDQQEESSLLLKQLHQVQEELEKIFINREELIKQVQESEKINAQAQTRALAAEKKFAELTKAKADSDKKATEAQASATAIEKKFAELTKAKADSDKKATEVQANAAAAEKKAIELSTQLQAASATTLQQKKASEEALQESELLLNQLHQVQEELESFLLKNKEIDKARMLLQDRLDRVLTRLISWADAEHISVAEIVNVPNHQCLRFDIQNLWVGQDTQVSNLSFLLGCRDSVPYLEFRPSDKNGNGSVANNLLPWPKEFKDEQGDRLLIAPGAPGAFGSAQAEIISRLSASQWRLIKGLLLMLSSQVNRLKLHDQADRVRWSNIARDLSLQLESFSAGVHFQSAEVMSVTQPEVGKEVIRIAIRDMYSHNIRVQLCVFEIGVDFKILKSGPSPQMSYIDFRPWKGAALPFGIFKPNSQDELGKFFRICVARTGRNKNKLNVIELDTQDGRMLSQIGSVLGKLATDQLLKRFVTKLGPAFWMQELTIVSSALCNALVDEI